MGEEVQYVVIGLAEGLLPDLNRIFIQRHIGILTFRHGCAFNGNEIRKRVSQSKYLTDFIELEVVCQKCVKRSPFCHKLKSTISFGLSFCIQLWKKGMGGRKIAATPET